MNSKDSVATGVRKESVHGIKEWQTDHSSSRSLLVKNQTKYPVQGIIDAANNTSSWRSDMTNILQKIKHEFLKVLPPTIFFFFAFNIVYITSVLMLRGLGIEVKSLIAATVLALIVGKVILIVDHMPFVNKFPDKPLIYNIVWKTFIYVLAVLLVRYLERFIPFFNEAGGVMAAHRNLVQEMDWSRFLAIQIWFMVLLFFYSVIVELVRVLGKDHLIKMFFGQVK
jgi:hypothetical protein